MKVWWARAVWWMPTLGALAAAGAPLDSQNAPFGEGLYLLHSTRFAGNQLPAGWVATGEWQVNDGLFPPASRGYGTCAVWHQQTALENTLVEAWFELRDPAAQVGLVRWDISRPFTRADVAGSLGLLDAAAGTLAIHGAWDGTNAPPPLAVRRVPFALQVGREYKLALWKTDAGHHGLGLWDTVTGARCVVGTVRRPGHDPGKQLDAPGVLVARGEVAFKRFDFSTAYPPRPRLLVFGDSNSEGEALKPNYEARYCKQALVALGGSAVLAARGRETTASLRTRLDHDLDRFAPEYVLVLLGTSEQSFESWQEHLGPVLDRIEARGAVPVLATIPPADHRAAFNRQLNDAVRRRGRPFADFARVLGRDAEGVFWDFGLQVDGIHPNVPGNRRMFERLRADVPQLFAPPLPAPPPRYRQVRLPSLPAGPGAALDLPLELTASGHENLLAFSLGWDPALLRLSGVDRGPDLPAEARLELATDQAALGQLGVWMELPPGQSFPAGKLTLLRLRWQTAAQPHLPVTRVQFTDTPQPRLLLDFGLEAYADGEVSFPTPHTPAAWWRLEGDTSEAANRLPAGALTGGRWAPGREGLALVLNGAGEHLRWPAPNLSLQDGFSVALWARPDTLNGRQTLWSAATEPEGAVVLELAEGAYRFGRPGETSGAQVAWPAPARDAGRWVQWTGTYDGHAWRLFRNGVVVAQSVATPGPTELGASVLGADPAGADSFFAGTLDEVRLYPRALAEWEVAALAGVATPMRGVDAVWLEDALPSGAVGTGHGGDTGEWTSGPPTPVSGARALRSPAADGLHGFYFGGYAPGWPIAPEDRLVAYVYPDPEHPPRMLLIQWQDDAGSWEHRAFWGEPLWPFGQDTPLARHEMGPLPRAGQWTRLEVPAAWVGLAGRRVMGLGVVAYAGAAHWDHLGRNHAATETTWLADALPPGAEATPAPDGGPWIWTAGALAPFAGLPVHLTPGAEGWQRHGWTGPALSPPLEGEQALFAWVFFAPGAEPDRVGLEWRDEVGSWEHRAYWGEPLAEVGEPGDAGWRRVGPLPAAGRWSRLAVPAGLVGLAGRRVTGLNFVSTGGPVWWARAGVAGPGEAVTAAPFLGWSGVGSGAWRLEFALTGPELVTVESSRDLQVWRPEAWFEGAAGLNAWPAVAPVGPGPLFYRFRLGR